MQRQKDIIKLQDEMILDIGAGVDRLHVQVYTIHRRALKVSLNT